MNEQEMKAFDEDQLKSSDKIPWCNLGYTLAESKEKCLLGGCWKYRCVDSKLNASWHEDREKWREKRYSGHKVKVSGEHVKGKREAKEI